MSRRIECSCCHLYLGEVAEGSLLRKNISHLCQKCETERSELYVTLNDPLMGSMFEAIFKPKKDGL